MGFGTDRKYKRNNTIIASSFIIKNLLIVIHVGAYTGLVDRDNEIFRYEPFWAVSGAAGLSAFSVGQTTVTTP